MKQLKEPCKSAIANRKCMGCVGLVEEDWQEPKICQYLNMTQNIKQNYKQLGADKDVRRNDY